MEYCGGNQPLMIGLRPALQHETLILQCYWAPNQELDRPQALRETLLLYLFFFFCPPFFFKTMFLCVIVLGVHHKTHNNLPS